MRPFTLYMIRMMIGVSENVFQVISGAVDC